MTVPRKYRTCVQKYVVRSAGKTLPVPVSMGPRACSRRTGLSDHSQRVVAAAGVAGGWWEDGWCFCYASAVLLLCDAMRYSAMLCYACVPD